MYESGLPYNNQPMSIVELTFADSPTLLERRLLSNYLLICTTSKERLVLLGISAQILLHPTGARLIRDHLRMDLHEIGRLQCFRLSKILMPPLVKQVLMC